MLCLGGTRGRADATASPLRCGISTPPMTASGPEILTCGGHVHAIEDLPDGVEVALERLGREPARDQLQDIVLRVVARAGELGVERLAHRTRGVAARRRGGIATNGRIGQHRPSCRPRRARAVHRQRALRGGAGLVTRERTEIGKRRDQRCLILLQGAEPEIAGIAKQAADHARAMTMIDAEPSLRVLPADRTHAALLLQQRVVLRQGYAVAFELDTSKPRVIVAPAGMAVGTSLLFDHLLVFLIMGASPL